MSRNDTKTVLLALLVVTSGVVAFGGTASAGHGAENGNYTVSLPFDSDHYPSDENPGGEYNASINHFAAGTQELFDNIGASDGLDYLAFVTITSQDIDFSKCQTQNTAAFGIDRDNDDPGTNTDINLLDYREDSQFNPNGIIIDFWEEDDFAAPSQPDRGGKGHGKGKGREDGDPAAELYPDDEIVAHQGYKSAGGPCYKMPSEPGWYQIKGYANGTSFSGNHVELHLPSHYFYICKCDSEEEAYQKLGPPPGQENPYSDGQSSASTPTPESQSTPTPTSTPESQSTPTADQSTPTPQQATATPQQATATATAAAQAGGGENGDGGGNAGNGGGGGAAAADGGGSGSGGQQQQAQATATDRPLPDTPTVADGPGFGIGLAALALLGAALLALRRAT
jgi:PGF-CTERM protein